MDKRARAGILTITDGVVEFEHILVEYDLKKVIRKIDSIKYPEYELIKGIFFGVE